MLLYFYSIIGFFNFGNLIIKSYNRTLHRCVINLTSYSFLYNLYLFSLFFFSNLSIFLVTYFTNF